jgi:hypothetical protein
MKYLSNTDEERRAVLAATLRLGGLHPEWVKHLSLRLSWLELVSRWLETGDPQHKYLINTYTKEPSEDHRQRMAAERRRRGIPE